MDEVLVAVAEIPPEPKDLVSALRPLRAEQRIELVKRLRPLCTYEVDPYDKKSKAAKYATTRNLTIILLTTRDPNRMMVGRIIRTLHWDVLHVTSILRWGTQKGYVRQLSRRGSMFAVTETGIALAMGR